MSKRLDELENQASGFEQQLYAHIDERLAAQAGQAKQIGDRLEGAVGSRLSALEAQAGKVGAKLTKNANRQLGQAYTYAFPYGAVYPTTEQALHGLQSGDVLGSMGLQPQGDTLRGGAFDDLGPVPVGPAPAVGTGPTLPALQPAPTDTGSSDLGPVPFVPPGVPVRPPPVPPPPVPAEAVAGGWVQDFPPNGPVSGFGPPNPLATPVHPPWTNAASEPATTGYWGLCPDASYFGGTPGTPGMTLRLGAGEWLYFNPVTGQVVACRPIDAPPGYVQMRTVPCGTTPAPAPQPAPPPPPPPAGPCPPGYHPVTKPGPGVWAPADLLGTPDDLFDAQHNPCPRYVKQAPASMGPMGGWTLVSNEQFWIPLPWSEGDPVPAPPEQWDAVTMHHWVGGSQTGGYDDATYLVPRGFRVWAATETGIILASPKVPAWACGLGEGARRQYRPGDPVTTCEPDATPPTPQACPVPDKPHCGPELAGQLGPLGITDDDICKAIKDAIDKVKGQNVKVADWIGMATGDNTNDSTAVAIMKAVLGVKNPIIADLLNRFGTWLQELLKRGTNALGCDQAALLPMMINRGVFRFVNQWTGAVPEQLLREIDQISNTICQSVIPSVGEADRTYMADGIKQEVWECWVKAAGAHVKEAQAVRDSGRTRPGFREAWLALKRGYIQQPRYEQLVRQAGVINDDDWDDLAALQCWWPGPEKLIRWMKKDVYDPDVVQRFMLDTDFDKKYTGETQRVADGLGLSRDQLLNEWRAHWENVGSTTMFECMRRLREGQVPAELVTTQDDVRQALKQQDVPPFWVERLIAISFAKPTRVDVRRMWTLHLIEEKDLKGRILDLGYTDKDADLMVQFWQTDRDMKEARLNGLPTGRTLVNAYGRGELTARELEEIAQQISYYPGQAEEIEQAAELARDMAERRNAIGAVKRRYTRGLVGRGEAAAELASVNVDADEIERLMNWWDQVKAKTGKEVTAAMLCQWRKSHLIGAGEQLGSLLRIGYDTAGASNIVAQCSLDMMQAASKAQTKAEQDASKAATKAAKSEAAKMKLKVRSNRTSAPSPNGGSANGAAGP